MVTIHGENETSFLASQENIQSSLGGFYYKAETQMFVVVPPGRIIWQKWLQSKILNLVSSCETSTHQACSFTAEHKNNVLLPSLFESHTQQWCHSVLTHPGVHFYVTAKTTFNSNPLKFCFASWSLSFRNDTLGWNHFTFRSGIKSGWMWWIQHSVLSNSNCYSFHIIMAAMA